MTRARKVLLTIAALLALLVAAFFIVPPLLFSDGADDSKALSIKSATEYQDEVLLERAWALPVAQLYKPGVEFQKNGSFCGPASVVNVLRSLGRQADQETVLDGTGTKSVMGMVWGGLTLEQLGELTRQKMVGKTVTVRHGLSLPEFRAQLVRSNDPAVRLILNFHRGPIFGQGGGHHSPIAGYLVGDDLALVLDVNEKYKPWLVKSERLYEAMDTLDQGAGKKRGLLVIEN